ncbi:radical SAM protein [Pectinatus frisingensis]|uniref:radical SAM protein n=1 Tax=Pectinatus frisingensis TaxID=865 RepID=UPI0018C5FA1D|nr:hypothetical protein [Pectinatus frisingensis]
MILKNGFDELEIIDGNFPMEEDNQGKFFWTKKIFNITFKRPLQHGVMINMQTPMAGNKCVVSYGDIKETLALVNGWHTYSIFVTEGVQRVGFKVDKVFVPGNDGRELGVCIRSIRSIKHDEYEIAKLIKEKNTNAILNEREFCEGKTILKSVPVNIAIGTETRCNIGENDPCVYCDYNWNIEHLEKYKMTPFSLERMKDYGDFFALADKVIDCSIGEPFMNKEFTAIIDAATQNKIFSFTTNGQLLNQNSINAVVGKAIDIYCSVDAACAATYAKYRNNNYDKVIKNIRKLCQEKQQYNNLPNVYISYLVMNSNKNELLTFVQQMKDINVDCIVLRRLNKWTSITEPVKKGDYTFNYADEIILDNEFNPLADEAIKLAKKLGIKIIDQGREFTEIGNKNIDKNNIESVKNSVNENDRNKMLPLCADPWKTSYFLTGGIKPCCYGIEIAEWNKKPDNMEMNDYLKKVFNGDKMQDIRSHLAKGEFSDYCLMMKSCPVVAKYKGEIRSVVYSTEHDIFESNNGNNKEKTVNNNIADNLEMSGISIKNVKI